MSKSKHKRLHPLEESRQFEVLKGIRKPIPRPGHAINPKDMEKDQHWDWRKEIEEEEASR